MNRKDTSENGLIIRLAEEADLDEIMNMIDDFVKDHPAADYPRDRLSFMKAYFKGSPIAYLYVAERKNKVLGMGQWHPYFDMFRGQFGGILEWLYVKQEFRGSGVSAAIIAELCAHVRKKGGEFIHGEGLNQYVSKLYKRVSIGWSARKCAVSGEAFQVLADLSGLPPREIVKGLPDPELNKVPSIER